MRPLCLVLLLLMAGCATVNSSPARTDEAAGSPTARGETRPAALVDDQLVPWEELRPAMAESVGGEVLGELVLQRRIDQALRSRHKSITEDDLERERQLLLSQLSEDPDRAARLLVSLRQQRGLGPVRFHALLHRNAGLRKLIQEDVKVSEPLIRQAYEQTYGPKVLVRLITVDTLKQASEILAEVASGKAFVELAAERSTHDSALRGGMLPPISKHDPAFPVAIRDVALDLQPGEVSQPISMESGFAILQAERTIEAQPIPFEQVRDRLATQVRVQLERSLMSQRARALLESADVTVLDPQLDRSWQEQRVRFLSQ